MICNINTKEIHDLPFSIILSFIVGYICYWFAYHGYEANNDKSRNYKIAVFALPMLVTFYYNCKSLWAYVTVLIVSVMVAILWRKYGHFLNLILSKFKISNATGYDYVLEDLSKEMEKCNLKVDELKVYLHSEEEEYTSKLSNHQEKYLGPFMIDKKGNILMYIDEINDKKVEEKTNRDNITYIPKESIKRFNLSYEPKKRLQKKD